MFLSSSPQLVSHLLPIRLPFKNFYTTSIIALIFLFIICVLRTSSLPLERRLLYSNGPVYLVHHCSPGGPDSSRACTQKELNQESRCCWCLTLIFTTKCTSPSATACWLLEAHSELPYTNGTISPENAWEVRGSPLPLSWKAALNQWLNDMGAKKAITLASRCDNWACHSPELPVKGWGQASTKTTSFP